MRLILHLLAGGRAHAPSQSPAAWIVAISSATNPPAAASIVIAMPAGHAGTFIAGLLARRYRKRVHALCLIDPVCFGMFMPHLLYNFLYRVPSWRGWGLHKCASSWNMWRQMRTFIHLRHAHTHSHSHIGTHWHAFVMYPLPNLNAQSACLYISSSF